MKYKTLGNCPYCDYELGSFGGWGMSPEGWASFKDQHDNNHPENEAQKKDRKECKHKFVETYTGGKRCNKCNMSLTEFKYSTPSPLEGFEEIAVQKIPKGISCLLATIIKIINAIISNQKKLYQYIKEKKI